MDFISFSQAPPLPFYSAPYGATANITVLFISAAGPHFLKAYRRHHLHCPRRPPAPPHAFAASSPAPAPPFFSTISGVTDIFLYLTSATANIAVLLLSAAGPLSLNALPRQHLYFSGRPPVQSPTFPSSFPAPPLLVFRRYPASPVTSSSGLYFLLPSAAANISIVLLSTAVPFFLDARRRNRCCAIDAFGRQR
ncbi:hypothetical protein MTO96_036898 [Rhipicephalus appendiculatus]